MGLVLRVSHQSGMAGRRAGTALASLQGTGCPDQGGSGSALTQLGCGVPLRVSSLRIQMREALGPKERC